jgi:hypothetical protein
MRAETNVWVCVMRERRSGEQRIEKAVPAIVRDDDADGGDGAMISSGRASHYVIGAET